MSIYLHLSVLIFILILSAADVKLNIINNDSSEEHFLRKLNG